MFNLWGEKKKPFLWMGYNFDVLENSVYIYSVYTILYPVT